MACTRTPSSPNSDELAVPFDVDTAYVASGYMGDGETPGSVEVRHVAGEKVRPGATKDVYIKVTYKPGLKGWAGVYWLSPADNWGDKPGHKIRNASQLVFWAVGQHGGEIVEFKAGGINAKTKAFRDSFEVSLGHVALTNEWKQFRVPLTGKNLSSVLGAFAWVATGADNPSGVTFYLDDIRYE